MIDKPFFSVVIPVYNKEPHVIRAINSVLNQTYNDFELIIVCDPSTDKSNSKISSVSDDRIKIFHRDKPGPGGYAARNLGIKVSNAAWVAFLDADDEWLPDHLKKLRILSFEFKNAKVLSSQFLVSNSANYKKFLAKDFTIISAKKNIFLNFKEYLFSEVKSKRIICSSVACIKRDVLLNSGGFPQGRCNRGGDVDTWLRCVEYSGGVALSKHIGAIYHTDSVNMVTKSEIFLAQVERETIDKFLLKYDGEISKYLKIFSNKRTRNAWISNNLNSRLNFNFISKLHMSVLTLKDFGVIFLSILPNNVSRFLLNLYK